MSKKNRKPKKANKRTSVNTNRKQGLTAQGKWGKLASSLFEQQVMNSKAWSSLSDDEKNVNIAFSEEEIIKLNRIEKGINPGTTYRDRHPELIITESLEKAAWEGCPLGDTATFPGKMMNLFQISSLCDYILNNSLPHTDTKILKPFREMRSICRSIPDMMVSSFDANTDSNKMVQEFDDTITKIREVFKKMPKWVDGHGGMNVLYSTTVINIGSCLASMSRNSKIQ